MLKYEILAIFGEQTDPEVDQMMMNIADYYRNLRYIPFSEFYNTLKRNVSYLREYISEEKKQNNVLVVLRIAYPMVKSALWVAMLAYPWIRDLIDGVECGKHVFTEAYSQLDNVQKIIMIYPDDCIYSGGQFVDTLAKDHSDLGSICEKIWIYSMCPYVTQVFKQSNVWMTHLGFLWNRIILGSHEELPSILYYARSLHVVQNAGIYESTHPRILNHRLYPFLRRAQILHLPHNFYFQHKMADGVSIALYILAYGYIPYNGEIRQLGSLINNCPNVSVETIFIDFLNETKRCPPSCYKYLDYTFAGQQLDKDDYLQDFYFLTFLR
jgi:hypothetical protein